MFIDEAKPNHQQITKHLTDTQSATYQPLARHGVQWQQKLVAVVLTMLLGIVALTVRGDSIAPRDARQWGMATVVHNWGFNLVSWEVDALWQKFRAYAMQPAAGLSDRQATELVETYLQRAQEMREIDATLQTLMAGEQVDTAPVEPTQSGSNTVSEQLSTLQTQLDSLRSEQLSQRRAVEQIIEAQISHELRQSGFEWLGQPFPPVQFLFVEPPRKLVVSPRDRITIEYSQMLEAEMNLTEIQRAENSYREQFNSSAYITNIGGLGAFPTMVIDRANLSWILSTVAHEWTHNYLTLFPLGFNYLTSHELTIMNETVAEIVGDELGQRALATFYPDLVPPTETIDVTDTTNPASSTAAIMAAKEIEETKFAEALGIFDFRAEMRETRLVVDEYLAAGQVEEAESYMEERRLYFVEHGYPLRVLNQAYFAFHGSYGTSAASTSPIGPKLQALRTAEPDLKSFLETVRSFTSVADLDAALTTATP